jgi:hypothetical protein
MRSRLLILVAVAAGAVAGVVSINTSRQQDQSRQEMEGLRVELAALKANLQRQSLQVGFAAHDNRALLNALTSLEKTAATQREVHSNAEAANPENVAAESEDLSRATKRPPAVTYAQSQVRVLAAYGDEAPDAAWSRDAERKLDALVRGRLPSGSHLKSIECRSTMCQVEVTHRDANVGGTFLMEGFRGWPGSLFVAGEKEIQGELAMTIIAAREGTEPPMGPR